VWLINSVFRLFFFNLIVVELLGIILVTLFFSIFCPLDFELEIFIIFFFM